VQVAVERIVAAEKDVLHRIIDDDFLGQEPPTIFQVCLAVL